MTVKRSGQAIGLKPSKVRQPATGAARSFDEGRQLFTDGTSRMNREVQVRICEGLWVKFPGPARGSFQVPGAVTGLIVRAGMRAHHAGRQTERSWHCDAPALTNDGLRGCGLRPHLLHVLPHRRDLAWRALFTPLFEATAGFFKVRQEPRIREHLPPFLD